jgi:hypothetical protein
MKRFYEPDLTSNPDSPFIRDGNNKLVRRSYWMDMDDRTLVMVMTKGIGAHLTNDEKRAHLTDLRREHLIDQVCVQEILPPEKGLQTRTVFARLLHAFYPAPRKLCSASWLL